MSGVQPLDEISAPSAPAQTPPSGGESTLETLNRLARQRILILDGGFGSQLQTMGLSEADYRPQGLADHGMPLKGDHDLLALSRPDVIKGLHDAYFAAGADFATTNSFSATAIAQADYQLSAWAPKIAEAAARLAKASAAEWTAKTPDKPRFVAGSIGPLNKTLSLSPNVEDPAFRAVDFDEVYTAYAEQIRALAAGGADVLLIETVFDTLNAKAAIKAALDLFDGALDPLPIWISGTITDRSGRTLSGQTVEAFWHSIRHAEPFAVGLNCALGADLMRPFLAELAREADTLISAYPNAGLPNSMGQYDETPPETCAHLSAWAQDGLVNILGGCCGTTPEHIAHIAHAAAHIAPRRARHGAAGLRLAGLEPFTAPVRGAG